MSWQTKGSATEPRKTEFYPWNSHGGRRETIPSSCLLTSTHTLWHRHSLLLHKKLTYIQYFSKLHLILDVVAHAYNPSTQETEAGVLSSDIEETSTQNQNTTKSPGFNPQQLLPYPPPQMNNLGDVLQCYIVNKSRKKATEEGW